LGHEALALGHQSDICTECPKPMVVIGRTCRSRVGTPPCRGDSEAFVNETSNGFAPDASCGASHQRYAIRHLRFAEREGMVFHRRPV
jgi:hypothetical protein